MYSTRWRYNGCNRVFACNFHILNNTFTNLISICSLNRAGFSDIEHAHFCCTFRSLNCHICKTYFFKLLLGILSDLHETWHVHSLAGPDLNNFAQSKNAQIIKEQISGASYKNVDISVKLNAVNTKLEILSCHETGKGWAKFSEFWPVVGAKYTGSLHLLSGYTYPYVPWIVLGFLT